ncbi:MULTISPECIES: DMT family transporter [unclassified Clostridium]|uniref:DMT family transporter n=1 Tax=unclassified Clostridium TaxID=2614128 RepID=UPI0002973281|nr:MULTISPECIES: DMT family transporter [unclassified Clostridium]EKQ51587.1 MAG: DMT(drug/metabolite transporter) superfamily permease [Clostridium sp. Maddingley MBC34-26]
MTNKKNIAGHLSALITIMVWGTTFVSTKVLLKDFLPIEILFFRFIIGYFTLFLAYPHKLKNLNFKQELYFAAAGLFGITLYFLFENIALTYTLASNVGVIVSIAPFFTALVAHMFLDSEKLSLRFFVGFIVAILGIILIGFNENFVLKLNPLGDILAVLATIVWAFYSVIMRKISEFGYNTLGCTRRVFFYGLLFMIPAIYMFDFKLQLNRFTIPSNLFNILYLGFGASAICFATWNWSVKILGAVKTSVYIYIVPVITVVASAFLLHENITSIATIGIFLALAGLLISEEKPIMILMGKIDQLRVKYRMR